MKRNTTILFGFALLFGCSNTPIQSSISENTPIPSTSPNKELSFEYLQKEMIYDLTIFCWQNPEGEWRCRGDRVNNLLPDAAFFEAVQGGDCCSLSTMREVIEEYYTFYANCDYVKRHCVVEVPFPVTSDALFELTEKFRLRDKTYLSSNEYLFAELGLEELYGKDFAWIYDYNRTAEPFVPVLDPLPDPEYLVYQQLINDNSEIFCWESSEGSWNCGALMRSGSVRESNCPSLEQLSWIQTIPCSLPNMKEMIDRFFRHPARYQPGQLNKVYEIDYPISEEAYGKLFPMFKDKYSTNRELYEELGLLEAYDHFVGQQS